MGIDSGNMRDAQQWTPTPEERQAAGLPSVEEIRARKEAARIKAGERINLKGEEAKDVLAEVSAENSPQEVVSEVDPMNQVINIGGEEVKKMREDMAKIVAAQKIEQARAQVQKVGGGENKPVETISKEEPSLTTVPRKKGFFAKIFGK